MYIVRNKSCVLKKITLLILFLFIAKLYAQTSFDNEFDFDSVPAFKACSDKSSRQALRTCFDINFNRHVRNFFRYPLGDQEAGRQGVVEVSFNINEYGFVQDIRAVGGTLDMRFNAKFIIKNLQRFKPAIKDGQPVMVGYRKWISYRLSKTRRNITTEYTSFKRLGN